MAGCHIVIAWLALTRQLTPEQRSALLREPEQIEAARRGGKEAAQILATIGEMKIAVADAETALGHLGQIPGDVVLDDGLAQMVPLLSSLALMVTAPDGRRTEDIDRVADDLQRAANQLALGGPGRGELLALRAGLLAARAQGSGPPADQLIPTVDALREAARQLPEGHLARSAVLNGLQQAMSHQVNAARSADDAAAAAERIVAMLEQMPRDDPDFARALTIVASQVAGIHLSHRGAVPADRISAQLEQAMNGLAPDDPFRPLAEAMHWEAVGARGAAEQRPELIGRAVEGLTRCCEQTPADSEYRIVPVMGLASALAEQYVMTGELRHLERARGHLERAFALAEAPDADPDTRAGYPVLLYLRGCLELGRAQYEPERPDLTRAVSDLERAVTLLKPDDPLRPRVTADLETARAMRTMLVSPRRGMTLEAPERAAFDNILATAQQLGREHADFPGLAAQAATGLMLRGLAEHNPALIDQAISLTADACAVPALTYRERPRLLDALGSALLTRYHLTRRPRDLSNAIDRLEEARRAVEQEAGSPYAAQVLQSLAGAYRVRGDEARGDIERAIGIGLRSLREHAGDVLLQDTDAHALNVARRTTSDAAEMAPWFLKRGRPEAAIDALELGRGMVLHAATSGAGLAGILADAGHAGLAAEWAREMARGPDSEAADDLRYRIMLAIEGSPAEARLLAPPSLQEIGAALTDRAVDALVYLLPRDDGPGPGLAVIVRPDRSIDRLPLPGLHVRPGGPVDAGLRARRAADRSAAGRPAGTPGDEAAEGAWREALAGLSDWAWGRRWRRC